MNAKYQVFVSSTYTDLKDERDLVIKAALEMGHIPVGMEMFSAADEEQWAIIRNQIDQSDYYVVIVAHRYGSTTESGLSYTEMEYDYAISKGIPVLGFILGSDVDWPKNKSETGTKVISKLNAFKAKVKLKPVSFWSNKDDLYGKCSIALMKAFNAYPREGWVRASSATDGAAAREVIRLSAENAALRTKVELLSAKEEEARNIDRIIETLKANKRRLSVFKKGATDWEHAADLSLYEIFETVAPELQVESNLVALAMFFAVQFTKVPRTKLRATWPIPRNQIRSILADFAALGCIVPSKRQKPVTDTDEYWCLGDFGVELLAYMRRRRLGHQEGSAKAQIASAESNE